MLEKEEYWTVNNKALALAIAYTSDIKFETLTNPVTKNKYYKFPKTKRVMECFSKILEMQKKSRELK